MAKEKENKEAKEAKSEIKPEEIHEKKETALEKETKVPEHAKPKEKSYFGIYVLIIIAVSLMAFNQYQLTSITGALTGSAAYTTGSHSLGPSGGTDLASVDLSSIQSTAQGVAALFPLEGASEQEIIDMMIPTGTPDYGEAMGVSFDDPINSMNLMAKSYPALKQEVQKDSEKWQRYLSLAAAPKGVSCEFCCGVGPQGIDSNGNLKCGCDHLPALQTVALWLIQNTDYSDAEILREVYRWKSLFFPKNMVTIASQIAGGDTSVLENLPGMVGGC